MLCESCGEYEANVHVTHVVNGIARKIDLCEECAAKSGINVQNSMSLADVLMGLGEADEQEEGTAEKTCPLCHTTVGDFRKTTRLGCPACYETFAVELNSVLPRMQKGNKHAGKFPSAGVEDADKNPRIAALQTDLAVAVAAEKYEDAARIRDEIRLRKAGGEPAHTV